MLKKALFFFFFIGALDLRALSIQDCLDALKSERIRKVLSWYNPLNWHIGREILVTEIMPENFYTPTEEGAVVGVDALTGWDRGVDAPIQDYITGSAQKDPEKNVHHLDAENIFSFVSGLMNIYAEKGPIKKMLVLAHGSSGSIRIGEQILNLKYIQDNPEQFSYLPDDLFAPDAEIVVIACKSSQGNILNPNRGIQKIAGVFSHFAPNGFKLIASRKVISLGLEESQDPKARQIQEKVDQRIQRLEDNNHEIPSVGSHIHPFFQTLQNMFADPKTATDPIDEVIVPPRNDP